MKKFTFGIAVYNVAPYLPACIESVMAQAGDDIEILLANDGSADGSAAICDEYAKKDSRIRVFHKENGGVSTVRNLMIEHAEGEWISFIDGDDLMTPDAAAQFRSAADVKYDLVYFNMAFFRLENAIVIPAAQGVRTAEDANAVRSALLETLYHVPGGDDFGCNTLRSVCAKLYRTEFLKAHTLRMSDKLRHSQDVAFNTACLTEAKALYFAGGCTYLYRRNPHSTVNRYYPGLPEIQSAFFEVVGGEVNDPQVRARLLLRAFPSVRICLKQYYCNPKNTAPREARAAEFEAFLEKDWCQAALAGADTSLLAPEDSAVYGALKTKNFAALDRYYASRRRKDAFKAFLERIGIGGLLKKLLRK